MTKTTQQLLEFGRKPDVKWAVARREPPWTPYVTGTCWCFWMEDDPRFADGILTLAKYRCVASGDEQALWERVETA